MTQEKVVQFYIDEPIYQSLISLKGTRTWAEFLLEDIVLRKPMTDASTPQPKLKSCEVCNREFPEDYLKLTRYSRTSVCPECYNQLYPD